MQGLHLVADLAGCAADTPAMTDARVLRDLCEAAVRAAGLTAVAALFHPFGASAGPDAAPPGGPGAVGPDGAGPAGAASGPPGGVTGVVLLAESHLAVHTWPELGAVTLDVYVCNRGRDNRAAAQAVLDTVAAAFGPRQVSRQRLDRHLGDRPATVVTPGVADRGAG